MRGADSPCRSALHHVHFAPHRHPHGRGRRPRSQLGHQERRLPVHRARLRRARPAPRLGGAHPHAPGHGAGPRVRPPARSGEHPDHRPDRRDGAPLVPDEPQAHAGGQPARVHQPRPPGRDAGGGRDLRLHAGRPREPRAPGDRHVDLHRRRRHLVVFQGARRRRRPGHRDPQDHGQRRARDRVLHRLLDRDHAGQGRDPAPADDPGLPRANRRLPDLRPQRGIHGPLHGVRDIGSLRDPGVPLRPPAPRRRARRGPAQQPQPVLVRDRVGGRAAGRDGAQGGRRGGCLRPPTQGEHRRVPGR